MIPRTLAMPTLLAASVAVPYVATNAPEWAEQVRQPSAAAPVNPTRPTSSTIVQGHVAAAGAPANGVHAAPAATPHAAAATANPFGMASPPLASNPSMSLSEVLRFDITKDWVYQRWDRKSTALADLDLFGVRVPLVSGTQLHDIAGSLTYFFGADGRVKRISFRGRTGDTTQLAMLLHQRFGLQAVPSVIAGQQLLQVRQGNDIISELRTQPAPILWTQSPHESFSVEFELQDPPTARPLTPQTASVSTPPPAPAPGTPAAYGGEQAAAPATTNEAQPAKPAETAQAEPKSDKPAAEPLGWKSLFPRSRATEGQLNQLNRSNFYQ